MLPPFRANKLLGTKITLPMFLMILTENTCSIYSYLIHSYPFLHMYMTPRPPYSVVSIKHAGCLIDTTE